jgi:hypothetical protein
MAETARAARYGARIHVPCAPSSQISRGSLDTTSTGAWHRYLLNRIFTFGAQGRNSEPSTSRWRDSCNFLEVETTCSRVC